MRFISAIVLFFVLVSQASAIAFWRPYYFSDIESTTFQQRIGRLFGYTAANTSSKSKLEESVGVFEGKDRKLNELVTDCSSEDDIMDIKYLTLDPDYPKRSINVTFYAGADFSERVEMAEAHVLVKYGYITFVNKVYNLCDLLAENTEVQCPIEPGFHTITVTAQIPYYIPPGNFYIYANAYRVEDNKQIGKIQAIASF